ncbi:MAG: DMT family transporter [Faecalibacterium sp.]|nr:DMT family transporter [Ruminococcus sp.]MCM1392551.1 DMT family transporter [Ruminococcus sp.]MCM1486246.1 DMT family transporter [Faecalibacterium sp.]
MNDKRNNIIGSIMLAVCAMVWGSSFVAQTTGAEFVGPFTFISLRSILGAISLLPVIAIMDTAKKKKGTYVKLETKKDKRFFLLGGIVCGVALCIASTLQQVGIDQGTEPGKAGFITAFYILLVPIFSIFLRKKIRPLIWLCVVISIGGLYLLCVTDNSIRASDIYVLICAVCFAIHILVIDYVSPRVDGVKLSCIQFLVCGIIAAVPMLIFEDVSFELIKGAATSIAYSGIMSSGVAYTLQILGQQKMKQPTVASMLMSLESVFSVLSGMLVLHQIPTVRETIGCVLMFAAIIIAQLPEKRKIKQN